MLSIKNFHCGNNLMSLQNITILFHGEIRKITQPLKKTLETTSLYSYEIIINTFWLKTEYCLEPWEALVTLKWAEGLYWLSWGFIAKSTHMDHVEQWKGETYDCRKYFMINLHGRMLPDPTGIKYATSWSPVRRAPTEPRGWLDP